MGSALARQNTRRSARIALSLAASAVLAFTVTTLPGVRTAAGFDGLLDGWLQGGAYVLVAVACALRPWRSAVERRIWALIAAALAARALGFVLYLGWIRTMDPLPYPSWADAFWIITELLLMGALVELARCHFERVSARVALDGVVGAFAVGSVAVALLYPSLVRLSEASDQAGVVATNLVYPIADVALVISYLGVLAAFHWRPPVAVWMLGAGVTGFAIVDGLFVYQVSAGTWQPGTLVSGLSAVAPLVIAGSAWVGMGTRLPDRVRASPGVVVPAVFSLTCLTMLVYASLRDVPAGAVVLAAAGALAAITRTGLTFRDLRAMAEAQRQARTDDVTGAANRRAFNEALEVALEAAGPEGRLALLVTDIDDFRSINESFGHHHGDEVLTQIAPRIAMVLRPDDRLARIGGDEFAVVLAGADAEQALEVAERVRVAVQRPIAISGREVTVDLSIGVARFPDDGAAPSDLLQRADTAMYHAKATGSGASLFRPDLRRAGHERRHSHEQLRSAIENGEMVVHYQPQVTLADGRIAGVEALVRWDKPGDGLLSPDKFLPQVAGAKLMRALTVSVLDAALAQAARWRAGGHAFRVAVNLAVNDLLDESFPAQVKQLLGANGVPGDALVLEITEDLFMANPQRGRTVMAGLAETGVTFAVDDYGTGYSSLAYLRELREVAGLKLDRTFVDGIESDPRSRAIVGSTIALAASLGLWVVAEGVETDEQGAVLAELGCVFGQGYFYCRPCAAEDLPLGQAGAAGVTARPDEIDAAS